MISEASLILWRWPYISLHIEDQPSVCFSNAGQEFAMASATHVQTLSTTCADMTQKTAQALGEVVESNSRDKQTHTEAVEEQRKCAESAVR